MNELRHCIWDHSLIPNAVGFQISNSRFILAHDQNDISHSIEELEFDILKGRRCIKKNYGAFSISRRGGFQRPVFNLITVQKGL